MGPHDLLGDAFTFFYVDAVSTSQKTHLLSSTACYEGIFIFYM
jgi:hypothetical protein